MAESKRRDRPKGAELRASLKTKKPVRTPALEELPPRAPGALAGSAAGAVGAEATDPFLSRNEFKPGFYEQNAGMITPQGLYGTASGKTMFESPTVDPDTSMMQNMAEGGSVRGQKNIQVKKKPFRGIF
jgi:hypothetical protein